MTWQLVVALLLLSVFAVGALMQEAIHRKRESELNYFKRRLAAAEAVIKVASLYPHEFELWMSHVDNYQDMVKEHDKVIGGWNACESGK